MTDKQEIPKLETTGNALYAKMLSEATLESALGTEVMVWRGKMIQTCESVGIPYGSYRKTVLALEAIGAIQMLQSGNRGTPTVFALLQEPTEELWTRWDGSKGAALTRAVESATMVSDAKRIIDSLGGINIAEALKNHEERIKALEQHQRQTKERSSGKTKATPNK